MKRIPLNMQTFSELITQNCVYVDKTAHIHALITAGKTCFLSRPRRFGKSLLISTLEAIFQGRKELFADLAISKTDYAWPVHPVIRLDFGILPHQTVEELRMGLCNELHEIAKMHNIILERVKSPGELLKLLVRELSQQKQVVILIDEYDKPILDHIDNFETAAQCQIVLKSLYETIKGLDQFCHFIFLTGVSMFIKTSVFSGLNNLNDISEKALGALVVGYTKEEIEHYFADHLQELVDYLKKSPEEVLDLIREWYDGYRFCTDHEVARLYAPLSVMYCLQDKLFKNYWFATGTPSYLVKLLKNKNYDLSVLEKFEPIRASEAVFGVYDVSSIALEALLYQAGYMTIKSYDPETNIVEIDYPNQEVRTSMRYLLLSMKVDLPDVNVRPAVDDIRIGFLLCDMHKIEYGLQTLLANIPSQHHRPDESFYHTLFHMIITVIGFATSSEDATHTGKPDLIVQTKDRIYIVEFKFNKPAGQGMKQILDRRYYECYRDLGKRVVLVEITFTYQDKRLGVTSILKTLD